jgi:hypothetical protein
MNTSENEKRVTESEGDIRKERDPKPEAQDVDEGDETADKEGNLPPAMPPKV